MTKTSLQAPGPELVGVLHSLNNSQELLLEKVRALRLAYASTLPHEALEQPAAGGWDATRPIPVDEVGECAPQQVQQNGVPLDLVADRTMATGPHVTLPSEGYNFFDELDTKLAVMNGPATGQEIPGDRSNA